MPALPAIPNVLRADLQWTVGGDLDVITRFFFRYSGGPPSSADAVTIAADIYSAAAAMDSLWEPGTDLTGVKVTDLSSSTGGVGEHSQVTSGSGSTASMPGSVSVLVNYVITRRYRGGKPRSYFPFGSEVNIATRQTWAAGFITSVNSALSTFFGAVIGIVGGGTTITAHVNVSYYEGFIVVTNPVTGRSKNVAKPRTVPIVDDILSWTTSSRPGSQRRRN